MTTEAEVILKLAEALATVIEKNPKVFKPVPEKKEEPK